MKSWIGSTASALAVACVWAGTASAALVTLDTYTGNVGLSTDGFGSTGGVGTISASAAAGSVVRAAFLYSATFFDNGSPPPATVTLNGSSVSFTATSENPNGLATHRADVTSIVAAAINGGAGGVYNFALDEGGAGGNINGEALVVIFDNPALGISTIGILDGFSAVGGDSTAINFSTPLDPSDPGFFAEMYIGSSHSCCSQRSTITVNGGLLTENAGDFDDGLDLANGSLITVGSFDDPFSPLNPSYVDDHEKYDLSSFVTLGDTAINIATVNPSGDDNIFLAAFHVSGVATVGPPPVPVPAAIWLLGSALAALGAGSRLRKSA